MTVLRHNEQMVEEENQQAEVFKEHLQKIHSSPDDPLFDPEWKEIVEHQIGYFPKPWKLALMTMIPKPNKDPHLTSATDEHTHMHTGNFYCVACLFIYSFIHCFFTHIHITKNKQKKTYQKSWNGDGDCEPMLIITCDTKRTVRPELSLQES